MIFVDEDMPNCLKSFAQFIKNVTVHQREPATHIFVFMISPEERNKNPMHFQFNVFHALE